MKITKKDPTTGKSNTYELPITQGQLDNWKEGMHIQHAMGNLTADQREFLISGIAIGTWDEKFPPEEEDESDRNYNMMIKLRIEIDCPALEAMKYLIYTDFDYNDTVQEMLKNGYQKREIDGKK
jgi:hypothetical protein